MTLTDEQLDAVPVGWCTGFKETSPGMRPKFWYLYLHTPAGHYRIDGITFPDENTTRRWAVANLPGLPEYE
jgi:hypothetical protein